MLGSRGSGSVSAYDDGSDPQLPHEPLDSAQTNLESSFEEFVKNLKGSVAPLAFLMDFFDQFQEGLIFRAL